MHGGARSISCARKTAANTVSTSTMKKWCAARGPSRMSFSFPATRSSFRTKCRAAMKPVGDGSSDEPKGAARQQAGSRDTEVPDEIENVTISRALLRRMLRKLRGADAKIYLALCMSSGKDGMAQASVPELA